MTETTNAAINAAINQQATIVTASARLARELVRRYDLQQRNAGLQAWQSAEVMPWEAWINQIWELMVATLDTPPLVLSETQLEAVWQQIITQDIQQNGGSEEPLWDLRGSARAAIKTLQLMRAWRLHRQQIETARHPDHLNFSRWLSQYTARTKQRNWTDSAALPALIGAHVDAVTAQLDSAIIMAGFDQITPQQQHLIALLNAGGLSVTVLPSNQQDYTDLDCLTFADEQSQWLAAGAWARDMLARQPTQKIAIVVPDLDSAKPALDYALKQTLSPGALLAAVDSNQLPFDYSLGAGLGEQPVIAGALALLQLACGQRASAQQISALLLSPFIRGYAAEGLARAVFDNRLVKSLPFESTLSDLIKSWRRLIHHGDSCRQLFAVLEAVEQSVDSAAKIDTFSNRASLFQALLEQFGWPGDGAVGSDNFQAVAAFRAQLHGLGELDLVAPACRLRSALSHLQQILMRRVFQPESADAPLQVLGIVETAGSEFDAVWLGNLVDQICPATATPDPFIAVALQRDAGMPAASTDAMHAIAEHQLRRIAASTKKLVLSRPLNDADTPLSASPLIAECNRIDQPADIAPATIEQRINRAAPSLEHCADDSGPRLQAAGVVAGGTALISAQSQCPRGAFLRYRLDAAKPEQALLGLDPGRRGALTHKVLERVWQQLGNSTALARLNDKDLAALIKKYIQQESRQYFHKSGCGRAFFAAQQQWLGNTLQQWFRLERLRTEPFSVLDLEQRASLNLDRLCLNFAIDRIDQFDDGALALIDYKTGGVTAPADWGQARQNQPQLPLYRLSQAATVRVIAFAQVRHGECNFIGICENGASVNPNFANPNDKFPQINVVPLENHRTLGKQFASWQQLETFWADSLTTIAAEFVAGDARIDPRANGICRNCATPAFCRSGNLATVEADEAEPADG